MRRCVFDAIVEALSPFLVHAQADLAIALPRLDAQRTQVVGDPTALLRYNQVEVPHQVAVHDMRLRVLEALARDWLAKRPL